MYLIILMAVLFVGGLVLAVSELALAGLNRDEISERWLAKIGLRQNFYLYVLRVAGYLIWLVFGALAARWFLGSMPKLAGVLIGVAMLKLIIHELFKARLAQKDPRRIMAGLKLPLRLILAISRPIVAIISGVANLILRPMGLNISYGARGATREDIMQMVSQGGESGEIDAADAQMIERIFEFDEKTADDIGCHRTDIVAIDIQAVREEIINTIIESEFSRIPVYEGSIDNIIGILHSKDLMTHVLAARERRFEIDLASIMRKPYIVPTSSKTDKLLENMRAARTHMAIVVDEYGGVTGLVTVEDLLEEIVGRIYDEYDDIEAPPIEKFADGQYIIEGKTRIEEIAEQLNIPLPLDEYETIGGFVIAQLDRIPTDGEQPSVTYEGYIFQVYEAREKRIYSILVTKL